MHQANIIYRIDSQIYRLRGLNPNRAQPGPR